MTGLCGRGRAPRGILLWLTLATLVGCAGSGSDDDAGTPPSTCTPSVDPASISFTNNIIPIFSASCALGGCHDSASRVQGLDLSPQAAHKQLVNVNSTELRQFKRVLPGDADASYLVLKIEEAPGIAGTIMPQGCSGTAETGTNGAPCLTGDQMQAIRTWILACAPRR